MRANPFSTKQEPTNPVGPYAKPSTTIKIKSSSVLLRKGLGGSTVVRVPPSNMEVMGSKLVVGFFASSSFPRFLSYLHKIFECPKAGPSRRYGST